MHFGARLQHLWMFLVTRLLRLTLFWVFVHQSYDVFRDFYRAMSVCSSVTRRYCVETAKHVFKLFSPSGSHTILIFQHQTVWQYSDGDPLTGASNARGYENFDQYLDLSGKLQDTAIVTMEGKQETVLKLSNGASFNELEWPLTQISRSRHFNAKYLRNGTFKIKT